MHFDDSHTNNVVVDDIFIQEKRPCKRSVEYVMKYAILLRVVGETSYLFLKINIY